jgi:predicted dehydrogenase
MSPEPDSAGGAVGIAVAGFGYWGPNVARNVAARPRTDLRVVFDASSDALARASEYHPEVRTTTNWQDVLEDETVDAIAITLPVPLHHSFARDALDAGKHVLVEKPLAQTVAQCEELRAAAEAADRILMVGHTFEYNAAVDAVNDLIESGAIGETYYVAMERTNLGIVRRDENAMWSLAPHDISILLRWIGTEPQVVNAVGAAHLQEGVEDVVFLTLQFPGSVVGHVHCSWLHPKKVRQATVIGSKKMVVYDDVSSDEKVRVYDKGIVRQDTGSKLGEYHDFARFQMLARAGDVVIPRIEFREPLAAEIDHFAESVLAGRAPQSDAVSGTRVVAVLEAAQRSLDAGGAPQPVAQVSALT